MLHYVGNVERIYLFKLIHVCACCNLHLEHCRCKHDKRYFDTCCPNRKSTF
jgi:hypothetical protein